MLDSTKQDSTKTIREEIAKEVREGVLMTLNEHGDTVSEEVVEQIIASEIEVKVAQYEQVLKEEKILEISTSNI